MMAGPLLLADYWAAAGAAVGRSLQPWQRDFLNSYITAKAQGRRLDIVSLGRWHGRGTTSQLVREVDRVLARGNTGRTDPSR